MQDIYQNKTYKFIVQSGKSQSVKIAIVDKETLEIFESQLIHLQKINKNAISAAFKQQCPQIKYFIQREENTINLGITIKMDFLLPVSENFILSKIQQKDAEQKYLIAQLKKELKLLQDEIERVSNQNYKYYQLGSFSFNQIEPLFQKQLNQGQFLIEMSGLLVTNESGMDCYDEQGNNQNICIKFGLQSQIIYKKQKQNQIAQSKHFEVNGSTYESYQYPFKLNFIATLKKKGQIIIRQDSSNSHYIIVTDVLLAITQVK